MDTTQPRITIEEFERVVVQYRPRFLRLAEQRGCGADAEDVVQNALLLAARHLGQFQGAASLATWLQVIVNNAATSYLRKHHHRRRRLDCLPWEARGEEPGAEDPAFAHLQDRDFQAECMARVKALLPQLPPSQAAAINKFLLEGKISRNSEKVARWHGVLTLQRLLRQTGTLWPATTEKRAAA